MILELIALASIAANKKIFKENQKKFHKHWNPSAILKDIEKINPNYYPEPVKEVPSKQEGIVNEIQLLKSGFLSKEEWFQFMAEAAISFTQEIHTTRI